MTVRAQRTGYQPLDELLAKHPHIHFSDQLVPEVDAFEGPLKFWQGDWAREIWVAQPRLEVAGLVEWMDNNPMVCADRVSVAGPSETLALIALGPLIRAGLLLEQPALLCSEPIDEEQLEDFLNKMEWDGGALTMDEPMPTGEAIALSALCRVPLMELPTFMDLYDEAYGRSFFVRQDFTSDWSPSLVEGHPWAVYRLVLNPGEADALLRVQVLGARDGKCGAAQVVHALNVMAGFEESIPF